MKNVFKCLVLAAVCLISGLTVGCKAPGASGAESVNSGNESLPKTRFTATKENVSDLIKDVSQNSVIEVTGTIDEQTINDIKTALNELKVSDSNIKIELDFSCADGLAILSGDSFGGCSNLSSIILPEGVEKIEQDAFNGCSSLKSITIPSTVNNIADEVFYGLPALEKITVASQNLFYESKNDVLYTKDGKILIAYPAGKKDVFFEIPNGIETISDKAFADSILKTVKIPESVNKIGEECFKDCVQLKTFEYDGTRIQWDDIEKLNDWDLNLPSDKSIKCQLLNKDNVAETIKSIKTSGTIELTGAISIETVDEITAALAELYKKDDSITIILDLSNTTGLTKLNDQAFYGCKNLEGIIIPEGLSDLGNGVFQGCTNLKTVEIPETVINLGAGAFSDCVNLETISIPKAIKNIENETFSGCENLKSIQISEGLENIGDNAFSGCKSLLTVTIPESIKSIGASVFSDCGSLVSLNYKGTEFQWDSIDKDSNWNYKSPSSMVINYKSICKDNVAEVIKSMTQSGTIKVTGEIDDATITDIKNALKALDSTIKINLDLSDTVGLDTLKDESFSCCSSLEVIKLPSTLKSIGENVFSGCSSLTKVDVDSGNNYFMSKDGILYSKDESVLICYPSGKADDCFTIPATLKKINTDAFSGCANLKKITVNSKNTAYKAVSDVLYSKDGTVIIYYPAGRTAESFEIPSSVKTIAAGAFKDTQNLKTLTVSININLIENHAFDKCICLKVINYNDFEYKWENIQKTESWKYLCPDDMQVVCKTIVKGNVATAIKNMTKSGNIKLTGSIDINTVSTIQTALKELIKKDSSIMVSLDMSETTGLTQISKGNSSDGWSKHFSGCSNLEKINLPDTITLLDVFAFRNCSGLKTIVIPDSVQTIGQEAFSGCTGLESVVLSNGVQTIDSRAFYNCTSLRSIDIPDSVQTIGDEAFYKCSLKSVEIPGSMQTIGEFAFGRCSGLESIVISNGVKEIDARAFANCTGLKTIEIPDSVQTIGQGAFNGCSGLKTIEIPESVQTIGQYAFSGCTELESVVIPNGVQTIDYYAFYNCTSLKTIVIPDSVNMLRDDLFNGCSNLKTIKYAGTETQWDAIRKDSSWDSGMPSDVQIEYNCVEE